MMNRIHFILYVKNQPASRDFYAKLLDKPPMLDVPGMTEFALTGDTVLGLMPAEGIERLLPIHTTPAVPRCELYLVLEDLQPTLERGLEAGARLLSEPQQRSWGARVAYLIDADEHVIALAEN